MSDETKDPTAPVENIQSGPQVVAEFVQKIHVDKSLDEKTVLAIEVLYKAGKLTTNHLMRILENARKDPGHGSASKT